MISDCNICKSENDLDDHHIQSKSKGGGNQKWNLAPVCPNCHRKIHRGRIIVEGFFFSITSGGRTLVWRRKGEPSITGLPDPKVYILKKGQKFKKREKEFKVGKCF